MEVVSDDNINLNNKEGQMIDLTDDTDKYAWVQESI